MIEPDPRIDPADLRNAKFPGSFRRYDAKAVEEFLQSVADRVEATNTLVDRLQRELDGARSVRKVEPTSEADPFDVPDLQTLADDELVRLVGEETAHVLTTARHAATDIRTKAEESAARVIREATTEAARLVEEAEANVQELTTEATGARDAAVAEADAAAAEIRSAATAEAEQMLEAARAELDAAEEAARELREEADTQAEAILEAARVEGRSMVNEAKEVRTRILDDLQRRRDLGRSQLERLIEGREQILAAYAAVRENVDEVTAQLEGQLLQSSDPADEEGFVGVVTSSVDHVAPVPDPEPEAEAEDTGSDPAPEAAAPEPEPAPDPGAEAPSDIIEPAGSDEPVESDESEELASSDEPAGSDDADEPDGGTAAVDAGEPDAAAALDGDGSEGGPDDGTSDVDALFARLRSDREESVARAQKVLAGEAEAPPVPADEAPAAEDTPAAQASTEEPSSGAPGVDRVDPALLADVEAMATRQEALDPLDRKLSRALKRHLADEQNEVLDALRRTESTDVAALLPDTAAHVRGYADVAQAVLVSAATAGTKAVGGSATVDVSGLAEAVGQTIVEPFRRRIERSAADVDGDADALDERLRALYREWKVEHIGSATADALLTAFALGQHAGAADGARLSWRIDPSQGPCPDAQDNALAGAIPKGETFPTGDRCPQAHPGCRCILVVEP